jgi:hypothetical protein
MCDGSDTTRRYGSDDPLTIDAALAVGGITALVAKRYAGRCLLLKCD